MKSITQILNPVYKQLLGEKEWKEFSKEQRDIRNCCDACRKPYAKGETQLHVHHLFYDLDRMPWEYDSTEVVVLCSDCHKEIHQQLQQFRKHILRFLTPRAFQVLNGALAVGLTKYKPLTFVHALSEMVCNERLMENHAKAWEAK